MHIILSKNARRARPKVTSSEIKEQVHAGSFDIVSNNKLTGTSKTHVNPKETPNPSTETTPCSALNYYLFCLHRKSVLTSL
jgi:hypothetical protein